MTSAFEVNEESADMDKSALLIMDMQNGILRRLGDRSSALLDTVSSVQSAARAARIPVLYVRVAFRDGAPEVSPNNQSFSTLADSGEFAENGRATQIHERLSPSDGEVLVTKRRVSAFAGSDLDVVLRSMGVDTLVLCGVTTSGVVLSTVRQAADLDFKIVVLADACADADDEVHRVLTEKVFPRQATVLRCDEWIERIAVEPQVLGG